MDSEKIARIELLKRKSRRKVLIEELKFVNLSEDSFLDIENNDLFCRKVFLLLTTIENKFELQGNDYKENIQKSIQFLKKTIDHIVEAPKKGRLFFYREHEIEAVSIQVSELFSNLDQVLDVTKFSSGYGDFILVGEDYNFGLCIERTERFYEFSIWGLECE